MSDRVVTWQQFEKHIYSNDCWIMVQGNVYNVNDYLVEHPGGNDILLRYSGRDGTQAFNDQSHSDYAISLRNARLVGKIESPEPPAGYLQRIDEKKLSKVKEVKKRGIVKRQGKISREEVSLHKSEESCWVILDGKVLDVTSYLQQHPGGVNKIMNEAGKDASKAFKGAKHSMDAILISEKYVVGQVESSSSSLLFIVVGVLVGLVAAYFVFSSR